MPFPKFKNKNKKFTNIPFYERRKNTVTPGTCASTSVRLVSFYLTSVRTVGQRFCCSNNTPCFAIFRRARENENEITLPTRRRRAAYLTRARAHTKQRQTKTAKTIMGIINRVSNFEA